MRTCSKKHIDANANPDLKKSNDITSLIIMYGHIKNVGSNQNLLRNMILHSKNSLSFKNKKDKTAYNIYIDRKLSISEEYDLKRGMYS